MSTACSVAQCSSPAHCNGSGGRGAIFMLLADTAARTVLSPSALLANYGRGERRKATSAHYVAATLGTTRSPQPQTRGRTAIRRAGTTRGPRSSPCATTRRFASRRAHLGVRHRARPRRARTHRHHAHHPKPHRAGHHARPRIRRPLLTTRRTHGRRPYYRSRQGRTHRRTSRKIYNAKVTECGPIIVPRR